MELKQQYDTESRALPQKKQFVMKRFAEVGARTNTHNFVGRSMPVFAPSKVEVPKEAPIAATEEPAKKEEA